MIAQARRHAGALSLLAATTVANALAYGYQVVMARLLRPADYAILTALFGVLILEQVSSQIIQSATAKLAAQYQARDDRAALLQFVRRWLGRLAAGGAALAFVVVALASFIASGLALPYASVLLLAATLFLAFLFTFTLGLLQGLARFGWMGGALIVQAGLRLAAGILFVRAGGGVQGAFFGATVAIAVSLLATLLPLRSLIGTAFVAPAAGKTLGGAETRFFGLAAIVLLAYAALTNVDAVVVRSILTPDEAGAYAGAVTMAKIVLFAPIAVGFVLLERTARAHARGEDTDRALFLAIALVLATSGLVALAYLVAPDFLSGVIVGSQYPETAALVGAYGVAALSNAVLSLWIAYFIGRGELRVGLLLALAVAAELALLFGTVHDAPSMVRVVLVTALATQGAAVATFTLERSRRYAGGMKRTST